MQTLAPHKKFFEATILGCGSMNWRETAAASWRIFLSADQPASM
ncbi:hypothetical protein V2J23_01945 [Geobacillus thermoleovorans]|nr:hypothetical protein [Geobacillus kaustophilus]